MATRFYLSSTAAADVNPAFSATWTRNTEGDRFRMTQGKDASAMTDKTAWAATSPVANATALFRQYVSVPMAAGIAFVTTDTVKAVIGALESGVNDNINRNPIGIRVFSKDGVTLRATLLDVAHIGPGTTEWPTGTATNRQFADGDVLTAGYTTVLGDRLVVEFGGQVSSAGGTTVTGTLRFGSAAASDLAEDETSTTDNNPWFEISRTIVFEAATADLLSTHEQYRFENVRAVGY